MKETIQLDTFYSIEVEYDGLTIWLSTDNGDHEHLFEMSLDHTRQLINALEQAVLHASRPKD